jgi:hypothetical protein
MKVLKKPSNPRLVSGRLDRRPRRKWSVNFIQTSYATSPILWGPILGPLSRHRDRNPSSERGDIGRGFMQSTNFKDQFTDAADGVFAQPKTGLGTGIIEVFAQQLDATLKRHS